MVDVKAEVRALLDRLPDDCSYADVQRGIAVLMWPKQGDGSLKPPERLRRSRLRWPRGVCRMRRSHCCEEPVCQLTTRRSILDA